MYNAIGGMVLVCVFECRVVWVMGCVVCYMFNIIFQMYEKEISVNINYYVNFR